MEINKIIYKNNIILIFLIYIILKILYNIKILYIYLKIDNLLYLVFYGRFYILDNQQKL